jgi:hypothetical protein
MNATELLAELRPPLETDMDELALERILRAAPEPPRRRRRRRRPLAVAATIAVAATAAVAFLPANEQVGLSRAVAALSEPGVLLHFKVTTTHLPSGAKETAETWQTPDGRRARTDFREIETSYDQRARVYHVFVPERNEILVHTTPEMFEDEENPFGSIADSAPSSPTYIGDLPTLLRRALDGGDPKVRHVGVTTLNGVEVDRIRIETDLETADAPPGTKLSELRDAPMKTVTIVRDVYVRHDNALPVRVVDHLGAFGNPQNTQSVSDFTDVQKLALDGSTEPLLKLDHPGAKRTVEPPFDDSKAR